MHVAYYDPATGAIEQCTSGDRASLEADPRPFVELEKRPPIGFDAKHRVVDGAVVPIA
uniref:hypothetical protein n=1 Tax=Sphingomonas populi TaxID=2484750 RepID=UPI0013EE94A0|nr:hypothetical protein [Sphingomonas populi]